VNIKPCHHRSPSGTHHIAATCPLCFPPEPAPIEPECPHGRLVIYLPADCEECLAEEEAERREREIEERSAEYR
jgi:hypothetical protein